jgi:carbonic anhydrase
MQLSAVILKKLFIFIALFGCVYAPRAVLAKNDTPDQVLEILLEGNDHFIKGETSHPSYITEAKDSMLEKQTPIAAIVSCSDSRVPPELIFDRGLGELFVIRVAGNVIGPIEMDSVQYAVVHLKVPLVIVLGHQNCGAVQAVLQGKNSVPELADILPLIDEALQDCQTGSDRLVSSIKCNVKEGVETLKNSSYIAPLLKQRKVKIVGAYYEIETGKVSLTKK